MIRSVLKNLEENTLKIVLIFILLLIAANIFDYLRYAVTVDRSVKTYEISQELTDEQNMLVKAIRSNNLELAQKAIADGADPNFKLVTGYRQSMDLVGFAAEDEAICALLIENGANPNTSVEIVGMEGNLGEYYLMDSAIFQEYVDLVRILIENGAVLRYENVDGNNAYETALEVRYYLYYEGKSTDKIDAIIEMIAAGMSEN